MRVRPLLVSLAAGCLLAGCSGSPDPEPAPASPAAAGESTAAQPATPGSTAASSPAGGSTATPAGSKKITAADGALTWTMPCAKPQDQAIEGNEEDQKTYAGLHGWACRAGTDTTAGVIVAELKTPPADDDAARQQLTTTLKELVPTGAPADDEFQGHPGISQTADNNGATAAYQGVSFGTYLVYFFTAPADDLAALTASVTIDG